MRYFKPIDFQGVNTMMIQQSVIQFNNMQSKADFIYPTYAG